MNNAVRKFFGGYFKDEAGLPRMEFTYKKEFGLDTKRLIITVFKDDNESLKIWKKISGFSDSQIIKISTSDNFWSMGDSGPCVLVVKFF